MKCIILNVCSVNCRLQLWGNTTLSVGLRRICWRSRGKELEPTTRRRTSWGGRCLSWMLKVRKDCAAIVHRLVCSWYEHARRQLRAWIHLNPHLHVQISRCGLPVEKVRVPAWISRRRMSLRSSHTASAPGPCRGQCVVDLMSRRHPDKMHIVKTLKHDHNLQDFDLFSSRRTLYPPWRILLYPTFQERMLMMVLGLLLAAKEKLIGICATLNKHTRCQMHLWTCTKMPHSGLWWSHLALWFCPVQILENARLLCCFLIIYRYQKRTTGNNISQLSFFTICCC